MRVPFAVRSRVPPATSGNLLRSKVTFPPIELIVTSCAVMMPLPSRKSPCEKALKLVTETLPLTWTVPSEFKRRLPAPLIGEASFSETESPRA